MGKKATKLAIVNGVSDQLTAGIDSDVEIPATTRGRHGRYGSLPWADLNVGDSFFVASNDVPNRHTFNGYAYRTAKALDNRFSIRPVAGGYRVWRTE